MRIAFDAKRAAHNGTGLGNYSRYIIELLQDSEDVNELLLYVPSPHKTKMFRGVDRLSKVKIIYPTSFISKRMPSLWRVFWQGRDVKKISPDIYHGLSNELPLDIKEAKATKKVVTIHDLIFLPYPQCYKPIDRNIYKYKFRKACEAADLIIAVSECTKKDIVKYFNIPAEKIKVIYQGCDEQFAIKATDERKQAIREKYELPDSYILYLGSIEERKNLMLLAKALLHLPEEFQVVAVGKCTPYTEQVETYLKQHNLGHRMQILNGVPFDELPALYQMANMFVYPSFYEGFGIPILEALNSGIPVIAATGSCLEEAGGPFSQYVDPDDPIALAAMIQEVYNNQELRNQMIEEGKKYASLFTKKRLRKKLVETYQELLNNIISL